VFHPKDCMLFPPVHVVIKTFAGMSGLNGIPKAPFYARPTSRPARRTFISILRLAALAISTSCLIGGAAAQDKPKRPLIFVPGIFGSRLCQDGDPNKLLWGSVSAWTQLPLLKLDTDGRTSKIRVEPCGPIEEFVYFGRMGQDVYGRFFESLAPDYKLGSNLFEFLYDWRLSSFDNADVFEKEIEKYAKQLNLKDSDQFDVVAHSMGGLVVTVSLNRGNRRIHRLVTVSTPFQGSAEVFPSLQGGWGWLQRRLVSMQQVRETVLSFPSIYELLPTYRNCCALGEGRPGIPLNMTRAEDVKRIAWMRSLPVAYLEARLDSLSRLRALTAERSPIAVAHMYGVKEETSEQVYLANDPNADPDHLIRMAVKSWMGDGTVLDYSAMLDNDLGRLPGAVMHERIMSDPKIFEEVKAALAEHLPPENISGAPLANCVTSEGPLEIDGATFNGSERVFAPDEEVTVTLSVRSSKPMQNPLVLRSLKMEGLVVSSGMSTAVRFDPVDQPQFDKERADRGGPIVFYAQKFVLTFRAPKAFGDAKVEFRCDGKQKDAVALWDFKVEP
jgi:pimeloyl-ACP methyl ester carboxylesterase